MIDSNSYSQVVPLSSMQASAIAVQLKRSLADKAAFAAHISMLGTFVTLVGFLAVVCHHAH
ncbi:MAG: hypothetical protein MN733_38620 [Nitrososphaera sp.]|nr:hypothetical protein [Nitrososphaera sp.]